MRVERSYLVRIVQVYEGEPSWETEDLYANDETIVCQWRFVSQVTEYLDDDSLTLRELK